MLLKKGIQNIKLINIWGRSNKKLWQLLRNTLQLPFTAFPKSILLDKNYVLVYFYSAMLN